MRIIRKIHPGYTRNLTLAKAGQGLENQIGKYQYFYENKNGRISLIYLHMFGDAWWEIYCLEGNLFPDTERFKSKAEAEMRIAQLLKIGLFEKVVKINE